MNTPSRLRILQAAAALLLLLATASAQLPKRTAEEKDAPTLFPAPDSLEKISESFKPGDISIPMQTDPRTALLEAASALRAKAKLFRTGKCTKAELKAAAAEVNRAAVAFRGAPRTGGTKRK